MLLNARLTSIVQFGSKQSSPQLRDGTITGGKYDGPDDVFTTRATNSTGSSINGSPLVMSSMQRGAGPQQRSLAASDPNPYFQHSTRMVAVGASPAVSPLGGTIIQADSQSQGSSRSTASVLGQSGGFQPFTGTSPNEFASYSLHDRFPFFGADAHGATAIRGN